MTFPGAGERPVRPWYALAAVVFAVGMAGVPVVGVGALAVAVGLRSAGVVFVACVIVMSGAVAAYLRRRPVPAP